MAKKIYHNLPCPYCGGTKDVSLFVATTEYYGCVDCWEAFKKWSDFKIFMGMNKIVTLMEEWHTIELNKQRKKKLEAVC
jgi:sarcosine oxidase delta subunit